jgi:hypothetical protein
MGPNSEVKNLLLFHAAAMLFLQWTKNYFTQVAYFSKIYIHRSLYDPILSGISVAPTLQVHASTMLVSRL